MMHGKRSGAALSWAFFIQVSKPGEGLAFVWMAIDERVVPRSRRWCRLEIVALVVPPKHWCGSMRREYDMPVRRGCAWRFSGKLGGDGR